MQIPSAHGTCSAATHLYDGGLHGVHSLHGVHRVGRRRRCTTAAPIELLVPLALAPLLPLPAAIAALPPLLARRGAAGPLRGATAPIPLRGATAPIPLTRRRRRRHSRRRPCRRYPRRHHACHHVADERPPRRDVCGVHPESVCEGLLDSPLRKRPAHPGRLQPALVHRCSTPHNSTHARTHALEVSRIHDLSHSLRQLLVREQPFDARHRGAKIWLEFYFSDGGVGRHGGHDGRGKQFVSHLSCRVAPYA